MSMRKQQENACIDTTSDAINRLAAELEKTNKLIAFAIGMQYPTHTTLDILSGLFGFKGNGNENRSKT